MNVYQAIAQALQARETCIKEGRTEQAERWEERLKKLEEYLPSGSGFDTGESINLEESRQNMIIIDGEFHVMNENGFYDGYAEYNIVVIPSLSYGCEVKLVGSSYWQKRKSYDGLKDYIETTYWEALNQKITWQDLEN